MTISQIDAVYVIIFDILAEKHIVIIQQQITSVKI